MNVQGFYRIIIFHMFVHFQYSLEKICLQTLTLSLLLMTQEAFVDSVDQDQSKQNVQSDL